MFIIDCLQFDGVSSPPSFIQGVIMARKSKGRVDENGRQCTVCGKYKPWDEFTSDKKKPTGHSACCKECYNKIAKAKYDKNKHNNDLKYSDNTYSFGY